MSYDPWRNPELPLDQRVTDLLGRLTMQEKARLLCHESPGIERLGIRPYNWWNEALHGVARNGRATVFPQAIALAATWDTALIKTVADAISDEGRAKHHAAVANGHFGIYQGLTFWSPNVNIFRDPRWGRGQETYGEDPYLTAQIGLAFVQGLQGDHPRYLKAAACAKHYAVHSGPEVDRHGFDAVVTEQDLHETYLPQFKTLVIDGQVESVMGAYNRVNGDAACAHPRLLGTILRGEWKFTGHVVSDCGALYDIHGHHQITATPIETAILALRAGCDLACCCIYEELIPAVQDGRVLESDLDRSLGRLFATRLKLGEFDPPAQVPFTAIPLSVVRCAKHLALAERTAIESVVLLKNDGVLPLSDQGSGLFVTGPTATNVEVLFGNYHGYSPAPVTILAGIMARVPEGYPIEYRIGCLQDRADNQTHNWGINEAMAKGVAVVCVGMTPVYEGEQSEAIGSLDGADRRDIALPAHQVAFVRRLHSEGVRVILVVTGGSPIDVSGVWACCAAIMYAWYPGEQGGTAIARLLFGDSAPSGRLPFTVPVSLNRLPAYADYRMDGRGYRFMKPEDVALPFGFGLSYTTFAYRRLDITGDAASGWQAAITVANIGSYDADEVVQLYQVPPHADFRTPQQRLAGFSRVHIPAGVERTVIISFTAGSLGSIDQAGNAILLPGIHRLIAGGCSPIGPGRSLGAAIGVEAILNC